MEDPNEDGNERYVNGLLSMGPALKIYIIIANTHNINLNTV